MVFNCDKALEISGNVSRYQIFLAVVACLCWFCADFVAINFPVLIFYPEMQCELKTGGIETCTEKTCCDDKYSKIIPNVIYNNIVTHLDLYCEKLVNQAVAGVYTVGIVIGAMGSSKLSDMYGRRMILMISTFLFVIGTIIIGLIPNKIVLLSVLVLLGIGASGATMTSFLMVCEVVSTDTRNIFSVTINSFYAVAGLLYYLIFQLSKDYRFLAAVSFGCGVLTLMLMFFFFVESPRYYFSHGNLKQTLKSLLKIAHRNGKMNFLFQYLKEEVFTAEQLESMSNDVIRRTEFRYSEILNIINGMEFSKNMEEINEMKSKSNSFNEGSNTKTDSLDESGLKNTNEKLLKEEEKSLSKVSRYSQLKDDIEKAHTMVKDDLVVGDETEEPEQIVEVEVKHGILSLCKYKSIRWTFIACSLNWAFISYIYYGNNYDMKKIGNEIFTNGYIMFSAEFVAYIATGFFMELVILGRKRTIGFGALLSSIFGLTYFLLRNVEVANFIFLFGFRFFVTIVYSCMYTYSTEVYPTSIRSTGLGINLTFARISAIIIAFTIDYYNPYLIFVGMGLIIFLIHFTMNETRGVALQDEIEEVLQESKTK